MGNNTDVLTLANFPKKINLYNVEVKIAGVWTDWYDTENKFLAFAIASDQADKYGENKVQIVDPEGKIL